MTYKDNKFLLVQAKVIMTPTIEPVIIALDKYFAAANHVAWVTSGLRDAEVQMQVIRQYLIKKGLSGKYPEAMTCKVSEFDGVKYAWQMGWSALLNAGVIINPPLAAKCLMHTTYDSRDRFGSVINQTPHATGRAFDIGGSENGISDEVTIIQKAMADHLPGLIHFLAEHDNNAVHCDCK
jgi:hypothetical protein